MRAAAHAVAPLAALVTAVLTVAGLLAPAAAARTTQLPTAGIRMLQQTRTGAWIKGWAVDPTANATATSVQLTVDGTTVATVRANQNVKGRPGHGFTAVLPLTSGPHSVCVVPLAVAAGGQPGAPVCQAVNWAYSPLGWFASLARTSTGISFAGWAFDPDTYSATSIAYTVDGAPGTAVANVWRADVGNDFPRFGHQHGFAVNVTTDTGEHTVCVTAANVSGGANKPLGCKTINAVTPQPPSAPQHVVAAATSTGGALLTWQAPASDGGEPITQYVVTSTPATTTVTVPAGTLTTTIPTLAANTPYTFSVVADNPAGASPAGVSNTLTINVGPPPQRTPAPVSTSRYIRNVHGASSTDLTTMRNEGYADAQANPSGHRYLILLDIGGQDEYDGGVVLSATTRFVSYTDLEKDLQAYVTGYHRGQRANAPVVIAAGTNNDMDVSASAGASWATHIVGPLRRYALQYSGMRIAGADDMEPGFTATYNQTSAWLGGFLGATAAPFVFNGSADGCAWTVTNARCNNGWWMSGLYHLAAGAAPTRIINLPQIYNTTMAAQWKYISLTGIGLGDPRVRFGGPLTEWTACYQAGGCGSLTGHTAWTTLWNDLRSDPRLAINSLPYSTDLRIDS